MKIGIRKSLRQAMFRLKSRSLCDEAGADIRALAGREDGVESTPFVTLFVNSTGEAAAARSLPRRLHFGIGARKNWSAARSPGLSGQEVMLRAS